MTGPSPASAVHPSLSGLSKAVTDKLAKLGLTASDIAAALREQNVQAAAGRDAGDVAQRDREQRAEIRENPKRWLRLGDEAWYAERLAQKLLRCNN